MEYHTYEKIYNSIVISSLKTGNKPNIHQQGLVKYTRKNPYNGVLCHCVKKTANVEILNVLKLRECHNVLQSEEKQGAKDVPIILLLWNAGSREGRE